MAIWRQARELNGWTWEYADLRQGRWCRVTLERGSTSGWQAKATMAATAHFETISFEVAPPGRPPHSPANLARLQSFLSMSGVPPLPLETVNAALRSAPEYDGAVYAA